MSKQSEGNTVMAAMLGIGIALMLAKGWLNDAGAFVKSKVAGSSNNTNAAQSTPGGSGNSGFAGNPNSGGGAGGGGGGSW